MKISHDREKLADAVVFFVTRTQTCGVTKLLKLLFLLDFEHFRQTARSVTGLRYQAWPKGPAPYDVWSEVKGGARSFLADAVKVDYVPNEEKGTTFARIKPIREFDGKYFSRREREIMERLVEIFGEATTDQMVDITHKPDSPWFKTKKTKGMNAEIDYMLALDGKTKPQLSEAEVRARLAEFEEELGA